MTTSDRIATGALLTLDTHQHVCWFYDTAHERMDVASEFLRGGLEAGLRSIYICGEESLDAVRDELTRRRVPVAPAEAAGSLMVLTASATYLRDGEFSTERMLGLLDETVERALNDGFAGIRACADMSWVLETSAIEDVLGYEALCNQFVTSCRATGLCLFDRARFPPALLERFGRTHAWVGDKTGFSANPYYQSA